MGSIMSHSCGSSLVVNGVLREMEFPEGGDSIPVIIYFVELTAVGQIETVFCCLFSVGKDQKCVCMGACMS